MDDVAQMREVVKDLQARLKQEIRLREDLEQQCRMLEKLVYRDPTTGLRTEAYLHARVREEIDRCSRYPAAASIVTLCAPEQKAGVLPRLGKRLTDELRESDYVFELKDQGLAILLVETSADGAEILMSRLQADLQHFIEGYGHTVTSFPVDANLADDFVRLVLARHNQLVSDLHPNGHGEKAAAVPVP